MKKIINGFLIGFGAFFGVMFALELPSIISGFQSAQNEINSNVYCKAIDFDSDLLDPDDYDEWEGEWTIKVPAGVYPNNTNHEIIYHVSK